jgi:3-oxoacyl-[acyl-carrier-protein] synthase II
MFPDRADVVITGIGALTAAGGSAGLWEAALRGQGTAQLVERFDTSDLPTRFAVEVRDLGQRAEDLLPRKMLRRTERYVQLGLIAAGEAWEDAGLNEESSRPEADRIALFVGTGGGGGAYAEESVHAFDAGGIAALGPFTVSRFCSNSLAGAVSIRFKITGPCATFCTACSSSTYAMRAARDEILLGRADMAIVVGAEAAVMRGTLAAFGAAGVLSRHNEDPSHAARPFDARRDGFVLGEGAGAVVLESAARAEARGARIRARLAGVGVASDAHHPLACLPDGAGAERAIRRAMEDAGFEASDIGYVNAHGSGTRLNDAAESNALRNVLGEHASRIPVSSTKPVSGHLIGASGVVEAVICVKALEHGVVPPTPNYQEPDPECSLDYVGEGPRPLKSPVVLSNSVGFGGVNACLAFAGPN